MRASTSPNRPSNRCGSPIAEPWAGTVQAATPATAKVQQGMLESSNVQPVIEITHMIDVTRAYQMTATLSSSQEDLMRQAISQLGAMPTAA